jgi:hypothetical protein
MTTKKFNLELARGKFSKEVILRNVDYGVAVWKKKQLIANGNVMARNVWITPINC